MVNTLPKLIVAILLLTLLANNPSFACDDTLVMLLTSKNPTSEFSKTIRSFMNSLSVLGTALKYTPKDDYSTEMNNTLESWLEFSKKYMTNPPEEAKNDRNWRSKMSLTAQSIGEIRKFINNKEYTNAHNRVLELSNTIGTFFESVGISDEKQVFITTSADINDLQRLSDTKDQSSYTEKIQKIKKDLEEFRTYLTNDDKQSISRTEQLIEKLEKTSLGSTESKEIDVTITDLRTSFEELRSRILMNEWFSTDNE